MGLKVVIVDADIISPGIHAIFGLDKKSFSKTLTDYYVNGAKIEDAVYDISETAGINDKRLFMVPSSIAQGRIADLLSQKANYTKLKKELKK